MQNTRTGTQKQQLHEAEQLQTPLTDKITKSSAQVNQDKILPY